VVALPTLTLVTSACILDPYHCATQARFLDAGATLTSADLADSGSVAVTFLQFRGRDTQRSLSWFIRRSTATEVTAVHIRRGRPGETGEILYTFTNGYVGPEDVITQPGPQLWNGTIDYEELFGLIRSGGPYVEVQTTGQPDGALRGQLFVTSERDWQDSCTRARLWLGWRLA
jgi:hypothetical protein